MRWVVLLLWAATECSGAVMLHGFIRRGGLRDEAVDSYYPATLFANLSLGSASIIPWICFLVTGLSALAIAAFVQLLATILVGTVLALPWHHAHRVGHPEPRGGGQAAFPYSKLLEAGHGALAWVTMVLAGVVAFVL